MAQNANNRLAGEGLPAGTDEKEDRNDEPDFVLVPADPIYLTSSSCGSSSVRPRPLTSVYRTLGSLEAKLPGR